MSKPKRHHYVPQFYLRRFSKNNKSIVCYNKRRRILIPHAPIKNQCAIDNFYSWDERVEPALGEIEGVSANLLRCISQANELPKPGSPPRTDLIIFMALQMARTKLSGESNDDFNDKFSKMFLEGHPEFSDVDLSSIRIRTNYPAALPMHIALEAAHLLENLGQALLINETKMPFLCSDNPVVKYNSQKSNIIDIGVTGLDSPGLQIFYPIDEKRAIYLFDQEVYSKPTNTGVRKIGLEDLTKINFVIYMSSDENIYLSDTIFKDYVAAIASSCDPFLPYVREVTLESARNEEQSGEQKSLLHTLVRQPPIETRFSFARFEDVCRNIQVEVRSAPRRLDDSAFSTGERYSFEPAETDIRPHLKSGPLRLALNSVARL